MGLASSCWGRLGITNDGCLGALLLGLFFDFAAGICDCGAAGFSTSCARCGGIAVVAVVGNIVVVVVGTCWLSATVVETFESAAVFLLSTATAAGGLASTNFSRLTEASLAISADDAVGDSGFVSCPCAAVGEAGEAGTGFACPVTVVFVAWEVEPVSMSNAMLDPEAESVSTFFFGSLRTTEVSVSVSRSVNFLGAFGVGAKSLSESTSSKRLILDIVKCSPSELFYLKYTFNFFF